MRNFKNTTLLLIFLIAFYSCKKDHNVLGVDVQPPNDGLNAEFCDTAIITATTIKYDSIASFNDGLKYLGSNQDPVFGRMDVGLYVNANIPNGVTGVSFGNDANLVSAEIILVVNSLNFVGDQTAALTYTVFGLDSVLNTARTYYSNNTSLHNHNSILSVYTGSYSVLGTKIVLRIPVDMNYGKSILNNPQYLLDNTTFINTYKGFYITSSGTNLNPVSAQGVISLFNLNDDLSGFYLHYNHGTPSATKQTIDYKFAFTGTDALRYNTVRYKANQGGNYLLNQQLQGDTVISGQQSLFLKGLGGTRIKVKLPFLDFLKNYADSFPIAVNRAEFIFNVDPVLTNTLIGNNLYYTPAKVALLPLDSSGKETYAVDQLSVTDFDFYGGNYDDANNRYVIDIARHVQAILTKKRKNYGFHLVVADPDGFSTLRRDNFAERAVLIGSKNISNTALRPKFNLSFIKYKHDK